MAHSLSRFYRILTKTTLNSSVSTLGLVTNLTIPNTLDVYKNLVFSLTLLILSNSYAADCREQNKPRYFIVPKNKTVWVSVSSSTEKIFSDLGLKNHPAAAKIENTVECPKVFDRQKIFQNQSESFSLHVNNGCEENLANLLGFATTTISNHGSMESGLQISWNQLLVTPANLKKCQR